MDLVKFLKKEMIWVKTNCHDQQEVFQTVAASGQEHGYVTASFLEKLADREEVFPTGLKLDGYGVALPHTDPECVNEQFIAVLTTESGIPFNLMEDKNQSVKAEVIFVLGLNEPHSQLQVLQQLMGIIQDKENISALLEAKNEADIIDVLTKIAAK
ncbi:PTS sugar transporter subunit IIA [Listeria costaricensis]|uniref:PTS sugar transporter subunit IIA n=1 Tax=Listeria costaricensis TaxID=2026604 RepID=UPI000C073DFB|nr:PTS sugar transporter subunit IIA [Listeria costaricensis]